VLAKSVTPSRIETNRKIIKLDSEDIQALAQLSSKGLLKRYVDPQWKVNLGFPDKQ
jgi:glycerol 2-dehydrogenase (NADP+)